MTTSTSINKISELMDQLRNRVSKGPWRMEQNDKTNQFEIFDKDFRLVASGINNEDDAVFIVNMVNWIREE